LYDLVATDGRASGTVARLALGLVIFPHAAQKVFGWFGGYGLSATYGFFTTKMGLPSVIAASVIFLEAVGSILLIVGAFSRVAAAGILAVMIGAVITTHADHGFFMNWNGTQLGEGFEFHLLAIGLSIVTIIVGGGALSVDRLLTKRLRPEVDPIAGKFMGGDGGDEELGVPSSGTLEPSSSRA
jgi:putative oxidoreductase